MIDLFINKVKNSNENDKIVYRNVLGAFLVKGGALFVTLFTLPAYINFFNNDSVLGIWFTLLSLLNWILNFDLGIGNGLRNHLSMSISLHDEEKTKKYISSAYFAVGGIVLLVSVIFICLAKTIDFNSLLNISIDVISAEAMYRTMVIIFVGVMAQFWLKLINSILYALQKSSINNFLVLCTNVLILLATLLIPSRSNEINIIIMAIIHALAVAFPLLIATIVIFNSDLKYARPQIKNVSKKDIKDVLSLGGIFFLIQIEYMIIMSTNEFLISKTGGSKYVVDYQVYYKLFSLGSTIFALALTPLWSVITKAKAEKNYVWIKNTYKKFLLLAGVFCAGEFLLIFFMEPILVIWVGADNIPDIKLWNSIIFAILGCLMILNSVQSSIANGLGELKIQLICFTLGAILRIPLSYILVGVMGDWIGVVAANVVCMLIYCVVQPVEVQLFFKKKILFSKSEGKKDE